ncbi:MAG TPA: hypothetical protein VJR70_11625 [Stellaceae bacterium]|nr:hypothetical protein [Stellaceae bacterium]
MNAALLTAPNRLIAIGGAGADQFTGGAGNDAFRFTAANLGALDTVAGGGGSDQLTLLSAGTVNPVGMKGVETIALAGGGINTLTLTDANFTGVTSATITVFGGANGNTVNAASTTGTHKLVFKGGAGTDIVKPGTTATLTGGAGNNQFVISAVGSHTITDFHLSAGNMLVLRDAGFNLGAVDDGHGTAVPQHLDASEFVANATGAFTNMNQRFAYNTMTGNLRFDADGNGPSPSSGLVASLSDHAALSAGATGNLFFVA